MPYVIEQFNEFERPAIVRMSFELPYLDWCRFEKSDIYRCLTSYLEELEKQNIPKRSDKNE